MAKARLETALISDWNSFHEVCKREMGFPDFYGMNLDAWIDCLTYIDEGDGMSKFVLSEGEMLHIEVTETEAFKSRVPEIFEALVDCSAFVNRRSINKGKEPRLSLVFL